MMRVDPVRALFLFLLIIYACGLCMETITYMLLMNYIS